MKSGITGSGKTLNLFYWVQEAARNCNAVGLIVCLSVCAVREFVSEENLDRLYNLSKAMGARFLRIFEPRKAGRFAGKDVLLNNQEIEVIHRFMISRNSDRAYRNYPVIRIISETLSLFLIMRTLWTSSFLIIEKGILPIVRLLCSLAQISKTQPPASWKMP